MGHLRQGIKPENLKLNKQQIFYYFALSNTVFHGEQRAQAKALSLTFKYLS